jgi:Flp pilus assembly protein CpaB
MEMEFQDTGRRRRMLLVIIGIALALVAGWTAYSLGTRGTAAPEVPKQAVLVAARDVPAREALTADDVTVRDVPIDELLGQAYTEPSQVIGRITAVPIYANQQLTPNLFASTAAGSDFSILEPDEVVTADSPFWRAVAVEVPLSRAVGGEIKDGQRVDLFVSVSIDVFALDPEGNMQRVDTATDDGLRSGQSTKITFQDLEVLKADPESNLYILKVDLQQAEQIAHVAQVAPDSFSIALRPEEDTRVAGSTDYGTTTDSLVMTYLFRVPQLVDLVTLLQQNGQVPQPAPSGAPLPLPSGSPGTSPEPSPSPVPSPAP